MATSDKPNLPPCDGFVPVGVIFTLSGKIEPEDYKTQRLRLGDHVSLAVQGKIVKSNGVINDDNEVKRSVHAKIEYIEMLPDDHFRSKPRTDDASKEDFNTDETF